MVGYNDKAMKVLRLFLGLSLVAALGISCGRPLPVPVPSVEPLLQPSPTVRPSAPASSHLVLWENFEPAQSEWLNGEISAFQKANSITIEVLHYASGDELIERVRGKRQNSM